LIDALIELGCISIDIKHRRSGWCSIEKICDVFNSDQNLIFGFSEKVDLEVTIKFNYFLHVCWLLSILASFTSKHILYWLISEKLGFPLQTFCSRGVEDLGLVKSVNLNSVSCRISFV